jgi:hypothetical protein
LDVVIAVAEVIIIEGTTTALEGDAAAPMVAVAKMTLVAKTAAVLWEEVRILMM